MIDKICSKSKCNNQALPQRTVCRDCYNQWQRDVHLAKKEKEYNFSSPVDWSILTRPLGRP